MCKYFYVVLLITFFLGGCETFNHTDPEPEQVVSFSGKANKGPFMTGSEVTIVELDQKLVPTGRTYFTEILDNDGSFEVSGIKLNSSYIEVRVNGFFYDECMRRVTDNKLSLSSVAKIRDGEVSNVNILTHLERKRVGGLIESGMSFEAAKARAFDEMMKVFGFETNDQHDAGSMLLLRASSDAEILFAASSIISAAVPWKVGDDYALWNSFLVNFTNDFGDNGKIDNTGISAGLFSAAYYVKENAERIRQGVNSTFGSQFFSYEIPEFENYVEQSLASSDYAGAYDDLLDRLIPEHVDGMINLLRVPDKSVLNPDSSYVIHIEPQPSDAKYSLFVEITGSLDVGATLDITSENWENYQENGDDIRLNISAWRHITNETNEPLHIPVTFNGSGVLDITNDLFMGEVNKMIFAAVDLD